MSDLTKFMQTTLKSDDFTKDFLISRFSASTDTDYLSAYGCYATINDKAGIDEQVISIPLPE